MNAVTWLLIGLTTGALHFAGIRWSVRLGDRGARVGLRSRRLDAGTAALAKAHVAETPEAVRLSLQVMAGAGPPSTTCNAGTKKDVDGKPAMTTLNGLADLKRSFPYGP